MPPLFNVASRPVAAHVRVQLHYLGLNALRIVVPSTPAPLDWTASSDRAPQTIAISSMHCRLLRRVCPRSGLDLLVASHAPYLQLTFLIFLNTKNNVADPRPFFPSWFILSSPPGSSCPPLSPLHLPNTASALPEGNEVQVPGPTTRRHELRKWKPCKIWVGSTCRCAEGTIASAIPATYKQLVPGRTIPSQCRHRHAIDPCRR
ncbi:hypothetical protein K438DRAFT_2030129 [Mycena galopus ATCC 62051]|nr:hypothetical protein K438DRAFT_2030129 [Mycena galopus ATCC 62051]